MALPAGLEIAPVCWQCLRLQCSAVSIVGWRACHAATGQSCVERMIGKACHRVKRFFRVADAVIEATNSMRKTRSIGPDIEGGGGP